MLCNNTKNSYELKKSAIFLFYDIIHISLCCVITMFNDTRITNNYRVRWNVTINITIRSN